MTLVRLDLSNGKVMCISEEVYNHYKNEIDLAVAYPDEYDIKRIYRNGNFIPVILRYDLDRESGWTTVTYIFLSLPDIRDVGVGREKIRKIVE
jgi:hypothetical protein